MTVENQIVPVNLTVITAVSAMNCMIHQSVPTAKQVGWDQLVMTSVCMVHQTLTKLFVTATRHVTMEKDVILNVLEMVFAIQMVVGTVTVIH